MKTRILSLALALVLLAALPVPGVYAESVQTDSMDVSKYVLQAGGLLPEGALRPRTGASNDAVKQAIYKGLCARSKEINIRAYNVSTSNIESITQQVLNEHPELFYVTTIGWQYTGTSVLAALPKYDDSYTAADVADYENAVQKIIGMLGADWSDTEKLLFLHDYLVTHCEYDLSYTHHNAHDALVVGSTVCQGYALAFCDLCRRCGFPCKIITSNTINHAWNLITLDGENFNIDCTWDDPTGTNEFFCRHSNFMLSNYALSETHAGRDWTDGTTNVYVNDPSSTRYDGAWWSDVETAVPIIGDIAAYTTSNDTGNFYLRNMRTGATVSHPLPAEGRWPVFGNPNSKWVGNLCSFTAMNGLFYFTLPTEIWSVTPSGKTASVYKLTQGELASGYAYGILADGNTLYYTIGEKPSHTTYIRKSLQPHGGTVTGERDGFSYKVLPDGTASITGCKLSGNVVIPQTLDGYTVTNLAAELFRGKSGITAVTIPASVTYFGTDPGDNNWDYVFSYCRDLKRIDVKSGNPSFCSVDGVLFSKDGKTLIQYPCSHAGEVYHTKAQTLCCTAFAANQNLKFLFLDAPDAWWYTYTFYNDPALTVFYTPGGNAAQKAAAERQSGHAQDGKAGNPWCALESTASLCTLPAGLQLIEAEAFSGTQIPWIIVPDGCTRIKKNAFTNSVLAYLRVGSDTVIESGALPGSVVVEQK